MLNVVLHEPEIPPNTGNAIRLCANAGARLHLIEPLGFSLSDKALRRAGLDYRDLVDVHVHGSLDVCLAALGVTAAKATRARDAGRAGNPVPRVHALTTKATRTHVDVAWRPGDVALFGSESRGLPDTVLGHGTIDATLRIPMQAGVRSMNLSNAIAVVVYEAWRQCEFEGGA